MEANFNEIQNFLESKRFRFAKSMPQIPHSYIVRKHITEQDMFDLTIQYIRDNGYEEGFGNTVYTYLEIGNHKYWTMGAPVDETIIINRAKI